MLFLKMMRLLRYLCGEEGGDRRGLFARRLEERGEEFLKKIEKLICTNYNSVRNFNHFE